MNIWHDISPKRIKKDRFYAVIEIPKGGKNKYELDKETGMLKLDRVLFTSTHYPGNYGFIPRTYASDNDPLEPGTGLIHGLPGFGEVHQQKGNTRGHDSGNR